MIRFHRNDLAGDTSFGDAAAIDTETLGLAVGRDRLCVVQFSRGDGTADIVQIAPGQTSAPNLVTAAGRSRNRQAVPLRPLRHGRPASCVRRHACAHLLHQDRLEDRADLYRPARAQGPDARASGRRDLQAAAIVGLGSAQFSEAQLAYAASDVLHLHDLREKLDAMLKREGRDGHARAAFAYLPDRVRLDLAGFEAMDIFSHAYP